MEKSEPRNEKSHSFTRTGKYEERLSPVPEDSNNKEQSSSNINRNERPKHKCCSKSKPKQEPSSLSLIEVGGRKIVKREIALAKIILFDDSTKTYEIMHGSFPDKLLEKAKTTSVVFVMQPEGLTVCYDCEDHESKHTVYDS